LLPMDQDEFIRAYFGALAKKLVPFGFDKDKLIETVGKGTWAMVANDGSDTNENVFWKHFKSVFGETSRLAEDRLVEFYEGEFTRDVSPVCGCNPKSDALIKKLKEKGFRVALATNPIFPAVATHARIRWAGMDAEDFEYISTYENSRYCKPTLAYYEHILSELGVSGEECLMVGNDAGEDMVAEQLGMKTFLLTDCLLNRKNLDITAWERGSFEELEAYIEKLSGIKA